MIYIIDCGSKKVVNFQKILGEIKTDNKTISMSEVEKIDFNKSSGIIISGSPILLTKADTKPLLNKLKFLLDYKNPVLGVCFGHQLIGLLYGAKISHGKYIKGQQRIKIIKQDPIFSNIPNGEFFKEDHHEYITVPKDLDRIAKSSSCENEGMKNKTKNIYGVQFHPEVSGQFGKIFLKNFADICNKTNVS